MVARSVCTRNRSGITLTEILIAILILGVGLASVATLFPLGLLRLRDAARFSRSAYLAQAATGDVVSRSLLSDSSFAATGYYATLLGATPLNPTPLPSGPYDPFIQDTPAYGVDWATNALGPGAYAGPGGLGTFGLTLNAATNTTNFPSINGPGLPFAYDPLWRYQTGYYPNLVAGGTLDDEARFGNGIHFIRQDASGPGGFASAYGLPRITNFTPAMLATAAVPSIFVSPEDVVWQEPTNPQYSLAQNVISVATGNATPGVGNAPSPVVPDLSISTDPTTGKHNYQPVSDWHYSWMLTGQLTNASNFACFDVNIVIFENRPFGLSTVTAPDGTNNVTVVDGETVVEAIFGYSSNINTPAPPTPGGYAIGADRTVLLRWFESQPDPVVKVGDWIADVTYERVQATVLSRWWPGTPNNLPLGINNPNNNLEWDNLPASAAIGTRFRKFCRRFPTQLLEPTIVPWLFMSTSRCNLVRC